MIFCNTVKTAYNKVWESNQSIVNPIKFQIVKLTDKTDWESVFPPTKNISLQQIQKNTFAARKFANHKSGGNLKLPPDLITRLSKLKLFIF